MKSSRGIVHHSDSTVTCPDCGRRFQTHAVVGEEPGGWITVSFKSKQTGRWGTIRIPSDAVGWGESFTEAWSVTNRRASRPEGA